MYRIGVDLGGTNIAVGLVDENYKIVCKQSAPTGADRTAEAIIADMAALCRSVCREAGVSLSDVAAIGVATPGAANFKTGVVEYTNNLPFCKLPMARMLSEHLDGKPVHIENDANAAAWGEAVAGAAKGARKSVMITLGTGVGGGIVIDGEVYSGFNCAGGELGHMVIEHGGASCTCGRRGCWEAYSSATALIRMTKEKMEECQKAGRETALGKHLSKDGRVTGRTAFDAMRAGDAAAREVVDTYLSYLVTGLTNIVNIFQPEVISLGGGVSGEGQSLIDAMMPEIQKQRYGGSLFAATEIRIAQLKNDAGIIGAAYLGIEV
ncbi:MAG: ROK family protein [Clostridia bacterium]|nr:ROK family protein [Clostridia bacterium]